MAGRVAAHRVTIIRKVDDKVRSDFQVRQIAADVASNSVREPMLRKAGMKRCYQCNGRFGLIRYRLAEKRFCSKHCLNTYRANVGRKLSSIKKWTDFLSRKV